MWEIGKRRGMKSKIIPCGGICLFKWKVYIESMNSS